MRRRTRVVLGVVLSTVVVLGCAGVGWALSTVDRWLFDVVLDPGPWDPALTPPAPDYSWYTAWAAQPGRQDASTTAIAELPAIDPIDSRADVFYVHPTTWLGTQWNGPIDNPVVIEATERGGTLIQASVFNACCAVWGPRYRQAHGRAFTHPDEPGDRALDVAFSDVDAAFDLFLRRTGPRGFIIAGHSQGSMLAARLLRERVAGTELEPYLIAAYLPGAPIRAETVGGLPTCAHATQTGCVVAWNARGPDYQPTHLEYDADDPDTMKGRICVNPLSWDDPDAHAPASAHSGALFLDTAEPVLKPAFADAQCVDGALVITEMGDPERDAASKVLLWMTGPDNYHPIEYQLFYADLRANAIDRTEAWLRRPSSHTTPE